MNFLRQATASQSRTIGPFISDTDFKTVQTGLTIANTDIKLMSNGGASASKNSGGGTHRQSGHYGVTFDATDTATVGELSGSVVVSGALPVFFKFFVIEEAVYDALFAASAAGYQVPIWAAANSTVNLSGTTIKTATDVETDTQDIQSRLPAALGANGNLKADVRDYNGTAGAFAAGRPEVNMTHIAGTAWASTTLFTLASHDPGATIGTSTLTQTQVTGGAYALNSASFAFNAALDLTTTQKASVNAEADTALADVGLTTTITGRIDAAVSTRSTLTQTQVTGGAYALNSASFAFNAAVPAAIADAVWDEAISGHLAGGSTGAALNAAGSAGDPWATVLPGAYGAGTAGLIVGTYLDMALSDLPTATENADALLNRDMSAVSDTNSRSPLNALRFLRNKWSLSGVTLTVTKENDSTTAWDSTVSTSAGADPIVGSDPT